HDARVDDHLNRRVPLDTLPSPRNQELQLEFQITRFGAGEGLLVVRDISRIYKLEQMRKDFVANVSHELRTPLTVIRGYLETLADTQDLAQENLIWQKALAQMQNQAARMTTLINDLTMLSKLETDPANSLQQAVILKPLLEMICSEAQTVSGANKHSITLQCHPDLKLIGNDRELHSAFSNLVMNAIKYSPPEKPIRINASLNLAGMLQVEVEDEGVGIEPQHISRLTERFYRVDASRSIQTGGTGLGVAIVKHILLRHDGRLEIQSDYGKGSRFSCLFPADRVIQAAA
ncbi:MAG: phosphate regulon sensor histidine kinase PhoR, partial [Pseudomonadota bacterium]